MRQRHSRTPVVAVVLAALMTLTVASVASAQSYEPPRCIGGCDAEHPITYDAQAMWATYGYPTYSNGCWWYDVEGTWWYMCPTGNAEPHNLYPYVP
jgi:hypothetical protein